MNTSLLLTTEAMPWPVGATGLTSVRTALWSLSVSLARTSSVTVWFSVIGLEIENARARMP